MHNIYYLFFISSSNDNDLILILLFFPVPNSISGLTMGVMVIGLWFYLIKYTDVNINLARGYVMTLMVFLQNFQVFNCCSEKETIFKIMFNYKYIIIE